MNRRKNNLWPSVSTSQARSLLIATCWTLQDSAAELRRSRDDDDDDDDGDPEKSIGYVLDMMRARIKTVEGARVKTIQFVDRNTIHGTQVNVIRSVDVRSWS